MIVAKPTVFVGQSMTNTFGVGPSETASVEVLQLLAEPVRIQPSGRVDDVADNAVTKSATAPAAIRPLSFMENPL